jgi:hypothetical protein
MSADAAGESARATIWNAVCTTLVIGDRSRCFSRGMPENQGQLAKITQIPDKF